MEQRNQLWACLGAKYLPSVLYQVRLEGKTILAVNETIG